MGQSSSHSQSLNHRERRRSLRNIKLPSLTKSSRNHSLSATFTVFDNNAITDLVNINTASEEQLMTLPLITREIAHNIIEYRHAIGKFRRVDDLALVSGIGAEKLYKMRNEICVRQNSATNSELTNNGIISNSVTSLTSDRTIDNNSSTTTTTTTYVDINTASIFELQTVVGVTQELAANIIYYRERKGRFKSVDELRKVKGIDSILFSVLKSYLIVNCDDFYTNNNNNNNINTKSSAPTKLNDSNSVYNNRKQFVNNNSNLNSIPLNDIFELLSAYSHRPVAEEFFYQRNGRQALRLATWNLHQLTLDKAENLGFLEVCCRTILENRLSIVAIQEVENEEALNKICDELNNPQLRRVREWEEKYHKIKYIFKYLYSGNHLGYIYIQKNDSMNIEFLSYQRLFEEERPALPSQTDQIDPKNNYLMPDGIIARMCIQNTFYLNIVNIKILKQNCTEAQSTITRSDNSGDLLDKIENLLDSDNIVLLGDFTGFQFHSDNGINYKNIFKNKSTNSIKLIGSSLTVNDGGSGTTRAANNTTILFMDNILLSRGVSALYTGHSGIVENGLTHLAIPNGWSWGGVASVHCPVWAEIYINNNTDSTLVYNHINNVNNLSTQV